MSFVAVKGWKARIFVNGTLIGHAESMTLDLSTGADRYFEIGERIPCSVMEGNEELGGSMKRAWIDSKLLVFLKGASGLGRFDIQGYASGSSAGVPEAGSPYLLLVDCVAEGGSLDIPQDGWITGGFDFITRTWQYYPTTA